MNRRAERILQFWESFDEYRKAEDDMNDNNQQTTGKEPEKLCLLCNEPVEKGIFRKEHWYEFTSQGVKQYLCPYCWCEIKTLERVELETKRVEARTYVFDRDGKQLK